MEIPQLLITTLVDATHEVFETMVFKTVEETPLSATPVDKGWPHAGPHVVATVAFAGYRCGCVSIYSSIDAAREIAGGMLGIAPSTVNGQIADAIGEIANMIAGTVRTRMADREPAWAIGVPTVTIGTEFSTTYVASTAARVFRPFRMGDDFIGIELILHEK
jgi:chemotaxis protein CheX